MKEKILLDGYGIKLLSIRGKPHDDIELHPNDYEEIILETNKGTYVIEGCPNCYVVGFRLREET